MSSEVEILADRSRVGFRTPYKPNLIESMRSLFKQNKGYWAPGLKAWVIPSDAAGSVTYGLVRLAPYVFSASDIAHRIESARRHPTGAISRYIGVTLHPVRGGWTVIRFNYDPVTIGALKSLSARYEPELKHWQSRIAPEPLKSLLAEEAGLDPNEILIGVELDRAGDAEGPQQRPSIDVGAAAVPEPLHPTDEDERYLLALSQPLNRLEVDVDAVRAMADRLGLYQHQVEAAIHLLSYAGCLLADDMGVGKTRAAIVAAMRIAERTVVVSPASLKLNWRREILACGVCSDDIFIINGSSDEPPAVPWLIVNYENLSVLLRRPELVNGSTQIVDEAHFIKEPGALRTQRAFELAALAGRHLLLTATPMLNGPSEMYTLLRLSGHPAAAISFGRFTALYSRARELLGQRITEWLLRRTKDEVLSLPQKIRNMPYIEPPQELREQYAEVYEDDSQIAIAKLTRLRQVLERMKLPFVIETAESVGEGSKVLIFCQYKATIANLVAHFGGRAVRFTGDESQRERDEAVARFNSPEGGVRYFVATMECGGVGLNLTAANYVIIASRHFTPSVQHQAEDRAFRIGQHHRVEVIVPTVANTVDEDIQRLLDQMESDIEQVLAARLRFGGTPQRENLSEQSISG
jgi:SNF2 family DNA or RNA helicase